MITIFFAAVEVAVILPSIMLILWAEERLVLVITRRVDARALKSGLGFIKSILFYIILRSDHPKRLALKAP
jgi:hypothetical protein